MSVMSAVAARLAGDATFTGQLSTYRGAPAIVVGDDGKLPGNIRTPFCVVAYRQTSPEDCKTEDGREHLLAVRVYTDATGSVKAVTALAERARWLLHRKPVGLDAGAYICECSIGIAPTDDSLYGRQVDVRIVALD